MKQIEDILNEPAQISYTTREILVIAAAFDALMRAAAESVKGKDIAPIPYDLLETITIIEPDPKKLSLMFSRTVNFASQTLAKMENKSK